MKHAEIILYQEYEWTPQKIMSVLAKYKSIKKYAFILHDKDLDEEGSLKKAHFHVYVNFGTVSIQLDSIAKWFDIIPNNVAKIKGHMIDVIHYLVHDRSPDKYQYSYDNVVANFDVQAYVEQEDSKLSVDELLTKCAEGEITRINHACYIPKLVYIKHSEKFERAFKYYDDTQVADAHGVHSFRTAWLAGETGTGKSTFVATIAKRLNEAFYFTAAGNDPFSKYANQKIVALDDIRPDDPFTYPALLKLLDPEFISPVHARYSDVILMCDYIFVTSPYLPHDFVKLCTTRKPDDSPDQLYRRLDEVMLFTKDEIRQYVYDSDMHIYKPYAYAENPAKKLYENQVKQKPKPVLEIVSEILMPEEVTEDEVPF